MRNLRFLLLLALVASEGQAQTLSGAALSHALQRGGHVILMGNAASPAAPPGPADADPGNPGRERQLDEAGKRQAAQIGVAIKAMGLPIGPVWSSPAYRALQTVAIAGLPVPNLKPSLGDGGQSIPVAGVDQASWLKALVEMPIFGRDPLIVTHLPNITAAYGPAAAGLVDGEALIFDSHPGAPSRLVARVKPEEWAGLAAAGAALSEADVPEARANHYFQRRAIEGEEAAAVGGKILRLSGTDTVRIEDDRGGLSLGYELKIFKRPVAMGDVCDQTVVEVYGKPPGPPSVGHGEHMFSELASNSDIQFSPERTWHRYRRVANLSECSQYPAGPWTIADGSGVFQTVLRTLDSLKAKAVTREDRSIPLTCAPACAGDAYQRLHDFLKADVKLVQSKGVVIAAENFRERLIIWRDNKGGLLAMRLEAMPPPPLS